MSHTKCRGTGAGQSIAPNVRDVHAEMDRSWPRVMAMFWARDVDIQFGKGRGAFFREADKGDIAGLVAKVQARMAAEEYPKFTLAVLGVFSNIVVQSRFGGRIALHWWLVRMLRDLATSPIMMLATCRFPNANKLDVPHISTVAVKRKMRVAGFGVLANQQLSRAKSRGKAVTLPKLHREEKENDGR